MLLRHITIRSPQNKFMCLLLCTFMTSQNQILTLSYSYDLNRKFKINILILRDVWKQIKMEKPSVPWLFMNGWFKKFKITYSFRPSIACYLIDNISFNKMFDILFDLERVPPYKKWLVGVELSVGHWCFCDNYWMSVMLKYKNLISQKEK